MIRETAKRLEASKKQQLAMAEIQGAAQVVMAKAQVKAQQVMAQASQAPVAEGEPGAGAGGAPNPIQQMSSPLNMSQSQGIASEQGQPGAAGVDIEQMAQLLAQQLVALPPDQQQMALHNLSAQSPELAQLVQQYASQMQRQQQQQVPQPAPNAMQRSVSEIDMRPQPQQLPARRMAAAV
jgi:hypothetical protein